MTLTRFPPVFTKKEQHPGGVLFSFGAGYGNRTRLCGLGSDRSTDELTLRCGAIIADPRRKINKNLSLYPQKRLGEQEIHQQAQGIHDGGDERTCHHRRVKAQPLG